MPRIPAAELARLKASTDLLAFLTSWGIALKPHGASDLVGNCPFHDDKTPSLVVTPSKGLWHCMGACQTGGDIVSFVMKAEGLSFREAVVRLGGRLETPCPFSPTVDDQTLLNQATAHYQGLLRLSPAGRGYLQRRGLLHEEMIETFKLGLSERSPGLPLPPRARPEGGALRDRLAALGILRQSTGHEHLAGSLVVPILDAAGNTLNLYGRKLLDTLRTGTPSHLYLPGPHRGVFNVQGLKGPEIILCESLLDALSFWVHGFQSVTASYGVEGFTEEVLSALKASGASLISIAYDRDEAGDRAAEKLGKRLRAEGFGCRRVRFPHGMDANDYICRMKPAHTALKLLLDTAAPMDKDGKLQVPPVPVPESVASPVLDAPAASAPSLVAPPELPPAAPVQALAPAPTPEAPKPQAAEVKGEDVFLTFGDRVYRVRGLFKNLTYDHLKVNLRAAVGERFFLDQVDLYNARHRETFVQNAAVELEQKQEVLKKELGKMLVELERLQDEAIRKTLAVEDPAVPPMPEAERREALALLQDPDLVGRILKDFEALGVVGESMNKLTAYLACVSRKMDKPLGLLIQSTSAAGKTALMDAVINLLPPEEYVRYSAMTAQSLYYMDPKGLKNKVLCICEEEGAERASYALKLLQSDGRLTIAAAGKDEKTGKLLTQEYSVEGPVAVLLSTTSVNVDEELQNRCLTLTVDESREQTQRIHAAQRERETVDGLLKKERSDRLTRLHQNAQRLLRPLKVANNYAPYLTFVDGQTRTRRDHVKYLTLIRAVTLLHQYQRPVKVKDGVEYIETTLEDIALANRLAHQVLGRTLDELPPQTRNLLSLLERRVQAEAKAQGLRPSEVRFTRRQAREWAGWGHSQVALHMSRLEEMEYLLPCRGRNGSWFEYELAYQGEGREGEPFLPGLVDVQTLRKAHGQHFDADLPGVNDNLPGRFRGASGPLPGGIRGPVNGSEANGHGPSRVNGTSEGGKEDRGEQSRANQSLLIPRSKASFSLVAP